MSASRKLKVIHVVSDLQGYNGAARQAFLVAGYLNDCSTILNLTRTVAFWSSYRSRGITVTNVNARPLFQFLYFLKILICNRNAIFHFHGIKPIFISLCLLFKFKVILKTAIDGADDLESVSKRAHGRYKVWLLRKIKANVVLSKYGLAANSKFLSSDRIHLVPNGVELAPLSNVNKVNHFVFAGLVCDRKNTILSIDFFKRNYAHLDGAILHIVGPNRSVGLSNEFDPEYFQRCVDLAAQLGISDQVKFHGLIDKSALLTIFAKSKALLFFSKHEGMPNVVLEAMSQNCVPVISDMGGVAHEICAGSAGVVVSLNQVSRANVSIDVIDELISAKLPYARACSRYSISESASSLRKIYEKIWSADS